MKFVDLFAGLGGFHVALRRLGHTCVFASEIRPDLAGLYERNFGLRPGGDIREIPISAIPQHDILCAGFPCQPFSKAGSQLGTDCPKWGNLFDYVCRVLKGKRPEFLLLENVPNLLRHDGGKTWEGMRSRLVTLGYDVDERVLSPHWFGVPQIRARAFIVGRRHSLENYEWPTPERTPTSILSILDKRPSDARPLSKQSVECLNAWQEFLDLFPKEDPLPSFPIWSMEFGATYPFRNSTPHRVGIRALGRFKGSHGVRLCDVLPSNRVARLPSHARDERDVFPEWNSAFIEKNRSLYTQHRKRLSNWMDCIADFPSSLQKFEWQCGDLARDIWKHVIQFRASGVRVKRAATAPALVAISSHIPIIGWEKRYLTPREGARLQSLGSLKLPESASSAFRALGNAVNARVIGLVARQLLCHAGRPLAEGEAETTRQTA